MKLQFSSVWNAVKVKGSFSPERFRIVTFANGRGEEME